MSSKQKGPVQAQEEQAERPDETEAPKRQKRTMPVRIEPLELEGDYEGWRFSANRNFTFGELELISSTYYSRIRDGMRKIVTGWDNFVDRDGEAIPFVPLEQLEKEALAYAKWSEQRDNATPGEFRQAPMLPPEDPWNELTSDLIYAMSRAVLGIPLPNK